MTSTANAMGVSTAGAAVGGAGSTSNKLEKKPIKFSNLLCMFTFALRWVTGWMKMKLTIGVVKWDLA